MCEKRESFRRKLSLFAVVSAVSMPRGVHRVNVFQRGGPAVLVGDEPPDRVRAAPRRAGVEIGPVGRVVVELPREVRAVDGEEPFLAGRDVMATDADVPLFGKLPFVLVGV